MSSISKSQASVHAASLKGQTVLLTGAASGLGKDVALLFASHGAKLVLGDQNAQGLEAVKEELASMGRVCVTRQTDVTKWDDLVALFQAGVDAYGQIDVVCPNAGVVDLFPIQIKLNEEGKLPPPNLKTVEINLISVIHATSLAMYHFEQQRSQEKMTIEGGKPSLRRLVLTGSLASFFGAPSSPQYSVAKAGVLGLMYGLNDRPRQDLFKITMIAPYFVRTPLLEPFLAQGHKIIDENLGWATSEDVCNAFLIAATDPKLKSGTAYTIPGKRGIWKLLPGANFNPSGFAGHTVMKFFGMRPRAIATKIAGDLLTPALAVALAALVYKQYRRA